jgi:hypothetical protein
MILDGCPSCRQPRKYFPLRLVWPWLLILTLPLRAEPSDLPSLSMRVNDFAGVLDSSYRSDLNRRLARFDEKTGYAIYVVLLAADSNQNLIAIARELVEQNQMEKSWSSGVVLLLIAPQNEQVAIATSQNLQKKFSGPQLEKDIQYIQHLLQRRIKNRYTTNEYIVEHAVNDILILINPWFYVLDPPSVDSRFGALLLHSPTAEVILFPLAPLLALMMGIILMAITSAGNLSGAARFLVSGFLGCFIAIAAAILLREPGGISLGMFYYSAGMGLLLSGTVGALRPLWFNDTFQGRKSGEPGPVFFRYG